MLKTFCLLVLLAVYGGCTNENEAKRILEENGYKNIRLTGYDMFACSEDDTYHTGFEAESPAGRMVRGTVCAGMFFKGATIRFK